MDTVNTELIRGHVDTIILNCLSEKDRYGYEILDIISDLSDGRYEIKQPTLYSCLKRLEKQGFITSYYGDESNGGRRRYYRLTDKGTATLNQDQREWEFSRTVIDRLLSDKQIDLKTVEAPFNLAELRPLTKRVRAYDVEEEAEKQGVLPVGTPILQQESQSVPVQQVVTPTSIVIPITVETPVYSAKETKQDGNESLQASYSMQTPVVGEAAQSAPPAEESFVRSPVNPVAAAKIFGTDPLAPPAERTPEPEIDEAERQEIARLNALREEAGKKLFLGQYFPELLQEEKEKTEEKPTAPTPTPSFDEVFARAEAMRTRASTISNETSATAESPKDAEPEILTRPRISQDGEVNYREALSAMFEKSASAPAIDTMDTVTFEDSPIRSRRIAEMKQSLAEEGFKLKTYSKANASDYYYMNYIYSNKILRDTGLLTYLVIFIELLILVLAQKTFGYSVSTIAAIGGVALLVPVVPTVIWAMNPTKRVKARFQFTSALINATIAFVVIAAVSSVIYLLTPSLGVGFENGKMYVPYLLALTIPISVCIYQILYRSNNYHLKN